MRHSRWIPTRSSLLIFSSLVFLTSTHCARNDDRGYELTSAPPAAPESETYRAPERNFATPTKKSVSAMKSASPVKSVPPVGADKRLSRFFLVEQPSAGISNSLLDAFRYDPPGGIVFWNSSRVGWKTLSETISRYSKILKENGHASAFFSIDDEGGGLTLAPSGKRIPGIQRFRDGFTDLAHGNWLGRSMPKFGTELCSLHGQIMGRELSSVGVNYPLTLVSDLAQRLFLVRGISTNPADVARCLSAFTQGMADAGPVVAVTKHYPGLGQNSGDTHDVESVSTAKTMTEAERHLSPFRDVVAYANQHGLETRLSIMSSHGKFPLLDSDHITTESPTLLTSILRDQIQFKGVRVSDAMWMGGYGHLDGDALYAVYANAFVSGLDLLMIPGNRFGGALRAFKQVADGSASPSLRAALSKRSGLSFENFQTKFLERVQESLLRLDATLKSLPYPHDAILAEVPRNQTTRERARYYEILMAIDQRWIGELRSIAPTR